MLDDCRHKNDMAWFLTYFAIGTAVGFLAGLLGIGGGMTLVPVLAIVFTAQQIAPDHVIHLALGTAMASIVLTSSSSGLQHYKLGNVDLDLARKIAPGMVIGSLAATLASGWIPQKQLAMIFAVIVYAGGTQILLNKRPQSTATSIRSSIVVMAGVAIGILSGLVSGGGAFLTVPFMLWHGASIHRAIGTAATLSIPIAVVGTIGYAISGWRIDTLPVDALGFISLSALAGIGAGSILTAPMGARLSNRVPVRSLRRIFACLLYALATKMLWTYWS